MNLTKEEQARRKDVTQSGVAQEALDKFAELEADRRSPSGVFTEHGYSLSHVLKPAIQNEKRIIEELSSKPSKDIDGGFLKVKDVKEKHDIKEFKPSAEPIE